MMEILFKNENRNTAKNFNSIEFKDGNKSLKMWFSYETLSAVEYCDELRKTERVIIKNYWNTTTGMHLNWIDRDKNIRLDRGDFEKQSQELISKFYDKAHEYHSTEEYSNGLFIFNQLKKMD